MIFRCLVTMLLSLAILGSLQGQYVLAQTDGGSSAANGGVDLSFWEELAYWEAIKESLNPAEYDAYLQAYPEGRFAALARLRIETLRAEQQPSADTPVTLPVEEPPPPPVEEPSPPPVEEPSPPPVEEPSPPPVEEPSPPPVEEPSPAPVEEPSPAPVEEPPPTEPTQPQAAVIDVHTPAGTVFQDCPDCPAMVVIPAGSFSMGSDASRQEQPVHQVSISQPLALSVYEISNEQWDACLREGGCRYSPDRQGQDGTHPVSDISWDDAREYIEWLRDSTGEPYRLASEAEWEYAARGGSDTVYWWGDDPAAGEANCEGCSGGVDGKLAVGSFAANPFGLYDVHGNVWEWTADCWNDSYQGAPDDGSPWTRGDCIARVLRGGAWRLDTSYMRSARRYSYDRDVRYYLHGLRVARDLAQ